MRGVSEVQKFQRGYMSDKQRTLALVPTELRNPPWVARGHWLLYFLVDWTAGTATDKAGHCHPTKKKLRLSVAAIVEFTE